MYEIVASLQVKIQTPDNIKITLGNIAIAIHILGIEKKLTEEMIHTIDEKKLEEYCGPENARGNDEEYYRRAGTKERHPVTSVDRLNLKLHMVEGHLRNKNKTFRPVEDIISFDSQNVYQEDIFMASAELAARMTYQDSTEGGLFTETPH